MRCRRCETDRPASELLEVVAVVSGQVSWVCRPGVDGRCVGSLRSAEEERLRAVPGTEGAGVATGQGDSWKPKAPAIHTYNEGDPIAEPMEPDVRGGIDDAGAGRTTIGGRTWEPKAPHLAMCTGLGIPRRGPDDD